MQIFLSVDTWISLLALTALEIILGVDNLVFIAIVTSKLHQSQQKLARRIGLLLAMVSRLILLAFIVWLAESTKPIFSVWGHGFSIRDMVLFFGGLFLLAKSLHELWAMRKPESASAPRHASKFAMAIFQIAIFDILFSLDSIITAVGIVQHYWVMATAIIIAIIVMIVASEPVSRFIMGYPRVKVLALCILLLVSVKLILAGFNVHVPSAYIFVTIGFALLVELVNISLERIRS